MGHVQHRYRLANHVGRVRTRLAKAITQAFLDVGITVICEPQKLWPALGYWKDHRRDVMRWEGSISVWRHGKFSSVGICSWEPMSDCLKGFSIWQDGFSYEVGSTDEKVAPSERYVCEFEADKYHANAAEPQP